MEDLIIKYAEGYALSADKSMNIEDEQRTAFNPAIFVFVGDKVYDAISCIRQDIEGKWDNSSGVLYFHIYSQDKCRDENTPGFKIQCSGVDYKDLRAHISHSFYKDEKGLIELNDVIRRMKNDLLQYGRMYSNFEKVNISLITRADDPLNILIPEIALLLKAKLYEDFKIVSADLYTLILERNHEDNFGFYSAAAMSFFREIEYFQSKDYNFNAPLEVLEEGIEINVSNNNTPIFDLVYLLSDKNEAGLILENALRKNYETISYISLLKNRSIDESSYDAENGIYNNNQFKNNIGINSPRVSYATAGLSKVKRPNSAIAVAVLYNFYRGLMERLKDNGSCDNSVIMKALGLDADKIEAEVADITEDSFDVEDMMCLMANNVSFTDLQGMNLGLAEKKLYNDVCSKFFQNNYEKQMERNIEALDLGNEVIRDIRENIINKPELGIYCAYLWTKGNVISNEIIELNKSIQRDINRLNKELDAIYEEPVYFGPMQKIFFNQKSAMRNFKGRMLERIYGHKLQILKLRGQQCIVNKYEEILLKLNSDLEKYINRLLDIQSRIEKCLLKNVKQEDEYLGQNIEEYYETVVRKIIEDFKAKYGDNFYFEERFIGNIYELLNRDDAKLMEKLIDSCNKYILPTEYFNRNFEDELHERANINIKFNDERDILTKKELFKKLYDILEDNGKVNIYILNFTTRHRYEEKYLFGNYNSDFIRYAFGLDHGSRTYKLGCVHERRTSGIEKLNLMGGFTIEDVIYGKNAMKYYEIFMKKGYRLHAMDEDKLPHIEY